MTAPAQTQLEATTVALTGAALITASTTATTVELITALWRTINPYDLLQVKDFRERAGRIIVGSQRSVAAAATAAQLMQLKAVGINQTVAVKIPDDVRGHSVTFGPKKVTVHTAPKATVEYQTPVKAVEQTITKGDASAPRVFERAAETFRYEKSIGSDDVHANDAAERKIADIVDGNLILAQRLAEQQTLSQVKDLDKRVRGYRRVIHPELSKGGVCGLCVAAASRRYYVEDLKPIHNHCHCSIAPITDGHDIGDLLNREDLDKLYDDAGNSTNSGALKHNRYELVDHNELGPVLVRIKGEKVPYYSTEKPAPTPKPKESKADVAKRLLPGMETSLADLRAKGISESSPQIAYHLSQIARLRGELASA